MTNDNIADQFSLLAKLMDIHGENSFKTKSYSSAAFTIEKLPSPLTDTPADQLTSIKGIGATIAHKITEIIETGELPLLREYINKTPAGILEMLRIKGLGPKKIATIWKDMEVGSLGELLYACQENRLLLFKGFGEKTQQNVYEALEFYFKNQGSHLYAEIEAYAHAIQQQLQSHFTSAQFALTGEFRRQSPIIDKLEWVTTADSEDLETFLTDLKFTAIASALPTGDAPEAAASKGFGHLPDNRISSLKNAEGVIHRFIHCGAELFNSALFQSSASGEFLSAWQKQTNWSPETKFPSEEAIFEQHKINYIPPFLREQEYILQKAVQAPIPSLIQVTDIRAIIHSHSKWSDGSFTLEEMARAAMEQGLEYLVISDHSKSAFYANGLSEERIAAQHKEIDELNKKLAPFVIFKSIEADILNDGALDYSDAVLSTFDLVIASVHSNLKMSQEKAMSRLLRAIENPYTTILGHMTGRLLLSRPGYPVDHKAIIDACAANKVVIELNAHPRRLDMDWTWINQALDKGVLISIDPDAHSIAGYHDVKYGVLAAQKAGLTPDRNLSSFTLAQFREYLGSKRK